MMVRVARGIADEETGMTDENRTNQTTTTTGTADDAGAPGSTEGDETFAWTGAEDGGETGTRSSASATGREWLGQLQAMIENAATQAGPVLREVAAKAAELAAVAGDKAGPAAARAAELTAEAGHRIAERSRGFASEIRRDQAARADEPASDGADGRGA